MYNSTSPERAEVWVRSADQPLDLALLDDAQRTVLRGYGSLRGTVPVGLYWLRLRAGSFSGGLGAGAGGVSQMYVRLRRGPLSAKPKISRPWNLQIQGLFGT